MERKKVIFIGKIALLMDNVAGDTTEQPEAQYIYSYSYYKASLYITG
jgi:hypothetical protein